MHMAWTLAWSTAVLADEGISYMMRRNPERTVATTHRNVTKQANKNVQKGCKRVERQNEAPRPLLSPQARPRSHLRCYTIPVKTHRVPIEVKTKTRREQRDVFTGWT